MKCPVCGFKLVYDRDLQQEICSEFCMGMSRESKEALKTLKPGEYGLWPCRKCGCPMDDVYPKAKTQRICSDCYRKERFATRTKLLKKAVAYLPLGVLRTNVEAELRKT